MCDFKALETFGLCRFDTWTRNYIWIGLICFPLFLFTSSICLYVLAYVNFKAYPHSHSTKAWEQGQLWIDLPITSLCMTILMCACVQHPPYFHTRCSSSSGVLQDISAKAYLSRIPPSHRGACAVVFDSLSALLLHHSAPQICRLLHALGKLV